MGPQGVSGISQSFPRRVIGPIPPRDENGDLRMIGEVYSPRTLKFFNGTQQPDPAAIKGLRLFSVDYGMEPILKVYARDEAHAVDVYRKEWGIVRFASDIEGPRVTELPKA